jgi:putative transposase
MKVVVGHDAGLRCTSKHWLEALDIAVDGQLPHGARDQGLSLMSDNGCQPASLAFMEACRRLGIHQTFTSDNNPQGHADTERFMRTLKEEGLWLQEWTCPFVLTKGLDAWLDHYHEHDVHSALEYQPPRQFERNYHPRHSTPFVAA